ncbi:MAG: arylsulfatase [Bacillota bacterium]|nr:arylsulfatase [Bacillota bacterium]
MTNDNDKQRQPNILLIMVDEMRGDAMGYAGHPDVKTPHLDSLAARGIYYPNAVTACATCVPARAILHTGLSGRNAGRVGYQDRVDWNYGDTLAAGLGEAGYQTKCVGKMHVHPLRNRIGFDDVELHDGFLHAYRAASRQYVENQQVADDYNYWLKTQRGIHVDVTDTGIDCNGYVAHPWPYEEALHPTNWVTERSIDFLRRRDPRDPFFLMVSYVRPHAPYDAPASFFELYRDLDRRRPLRPPFTGDWNDHERHEREGRLHNSMSSPLDQDQVRQMQIGYYACITHIDHQIGRLLIALHHYDLEEDTVIIFVSDHGELLGDHLLIRKTVPYRGSISIPLIVTGPEAYVGRAGTVDSRVAELRDILPTCWALAGHETRRPLDGEDLLQPTTREYLHGEHVVDEKDSAQFIVTERDKYIWFSGSGREQYFDLTIDPNESHDAIAETRYQERIAELRACLVRELDGSEEGYVADGQLVTGRRPTAVLSNATASLRV